MCILLNRSRPWRHVRVPRHAKIERYHSGHFGHHTAAPQTMNMVTGRLVDPQEAADVIVLLASPRSAQPAPTSQSTAASSNRSETNDPALAFILHIRPDCR